MRTGYFPCSCCSLGGLSDTPCQSAQEIAALVGALLDIEHDIVTAADAGDAAGSVLATITHQLGEAPRCYPTRLRGEPAYPDPELIEARIGTTEAKT